MKLWNLLLTVVLGSKCPDQCQCYAGPNEPMCVMLGLTEFPDISQSPDIENFILLGNNITTLPQLANQERILLTIVSLPASNTMKNERVTDPR